MKILKIVNSSDTGGVFTCETQFLKLFKEKGIHVDLVIVGEGDKKKIYEAAGEKIYYLPQADFLFGGTPIDRALSLKKAFDYGNRYSKKLLSQIEDDYSSIIYRRENLMFLAGILGQKINVQCYWHMANSVGSKFSKIVYQNITKYFKIVPIANSRYTLESLGANFCREIVYPGYNTERLQIDSKIFREKYSRKNQAIFGMLTRVENDKAIDIVVQAFMQIEEMKDAVLLIAGGPLDSNYALKCQMLVKDYPNIKFIGPITSVSEFYSSVDVMINGRRNAEPFGITIAESMFCGKPIIAYYKGGPNEMIQDGETGWLVYEPTIEAYKKSLKIALEQKQNWEVMGQRGKENSSKYSADVNVEKMIEIVNQRSLRKKS